MHDDIKVLAARLARSDNEGDFRIGNMILTKIAENETKQIRTALSTPDEVELIKKYKEMLLQKYK